jgi:nicotinate-nucleotide--dimethylbenzimidazole phosphoribosyltransferase
MNDLLSLASDVDWSDTDAATAARTALAATGLDPGRLGEFAEWLAEAQGCYPPREFTRVRTIVFGAKPGPAGCAGVEAIAEPAHSGVRWVAQLEDATQAAIAAGVALADEEIDAGADLLIVAVPGPGVHPSAMALISVLTNTEPVKVLPRGARLSTAAWTSLAVDVRDARRRGMAIRAEPTELLSAIGGTELAAAAGFLLRSAGRRTPVLLDGLPAAAAALVAYEAQPRAVRWWQSADRSHGPAHDIALTKLGMRSVLDLGIGLADGTAGLLAVPVLRAAIRIAAPLVTPVDIAGADHGAEVGS